MCNLYLFSLFILLNYINVCEQDIDLIHTDDVNEKKRKFIVSPPPMSSSQLSINKRQRLNVESGNSDV